MKDKGTALYQTALLILSVYVLAALVAESFFVEDVEIEKVLQYIDFFVCLLFLADFAVNFVKAEDRAKFMKWGWIDLVSSIPMVDPLRWGRLARVVRILRFLRAIRSIRILYRTLIQNRVQSLSILVFLFVFISYSLAACIVIEFERGYDSPVESAEAALWWAFLNLMNAKTSINAAVSVEASFAAIYLNKVGLVLFAYVNAVMIAWLLEKKGSGSHVKKGSEIRQQ